MVSGLSGIHMGKLPFKYLGCYLYKGRRKLSYFQHLVDAVNNRLVGWKNKFLSPGGRLILIKHVLSTIPIHVMAALDLPKGTSLSAFSLIFCGGRVMIPKGGFGAHGIVSLSLSMKMDWEFVSCMMFFHRSLANSGGNGAQAVAFGLGTFPLYPPQNR